MVFIKCSKELANFTYSITEAEKIHWTRRMHIYSLHKTGFEKSKGNQSALFIGKTHSNLISIKHQFLGHQLPIPA